MDTWEKCTNPQTGAVQYRRGHDLVYLEHDGWMLSVRVRVPMVPIDSHVHLCYGPFPTAMLAMMEG